MFKLSMYKLALLLLPLAVAGGLLFANGHAAAQATFNYTDHLMDDSVFRAYNTMSATDIQTFLQNEGSGLANFSDTEVCGNDARGAMMSSYATYYSCGTQQKASKIIYDTSQAYGINPQVLLATMQKEQSLVTTPNPTTSQLNYAMGYGCPDGGSCSYPGFFTQVAWASWQFRYDYEAINGNSYGGYTSASYPCNGATRYYSTALKTGNNVTFYDDNGTAYTSFVLPNASTSSLYCYTPHVYPGSSQEYFSGSYWFVYYYNLWFVPYAAAYYQESAYPQANSGTVNSVYIMYKNVGSVNWYDDTSIGSAPTGSYPVHLATSHNLNRPSSFSADWPAPNRPTYNFSAVYQSDGTTLATNQHMVQPGQIVKFSFNLTVPSSLAPKTYSEYFQPVADGTSSGMFGDPGTYLNIVVNATNSVAWVGQSPYPTIAPSQTAASSLMIKNSGNVPLYDDASIATAPSGSYPLHLATANPINRCSDFSASWVSCNRVVNTFSAVYKSDGTTLAANQHAAQPGEIMKFNFNFVVPAGYANGAYQEYLQPILEGTSNGGLSNLGVFYTITVPQTPAITFTQVPSIASLVANQPLQLTYTLSNSGNSTLSSGSLIYTDNGSAFKAPSWQDNNIVTSLGTDVAAGQSTTFSVPALAPNIAGAYATHFSLVNNGSTAALPGSNTTFNTNVAAPTYRTTYVNESSAPSFTYNQTANAFFSYKNTGNQPWYDDTSIGSATWRNAYPVHLATSQPLNRNSGFALNWPTSNRPTNTFSAVYESDGATLTSNQHVVQPGQIAKFSFNTSPQAWVGSGVTREFFQPIAEGTSNGSFNNPGTFLDFTVLPYSFHATYSTESPSPSLASGQSATIFFSYTNDGTAPWFDDTSFNTAPSSQKAYAVHLATSHGLNRSSTFVDTSWPSNNRPTFNFTSVYESDGATLTSNQHVVQPGQIAKFSFTTKHQAGHPLGTYREFFQPIAEGTSNGSFNDPWTFLDITVH